jgi:hypothetical protein
LIKYSRHQVFNIKNISPHTSRILNFVSDFKNIMAKMMLGVFTDRDDAEEAIVNLEDAGFKTKDISVIMKDQLEGERLGHNTGANVTEGAASGAATGGVIGGLAGLLAGIGALTIPGLGAILIGGPIAAALGLTGAAATTVSGAITGALAGGLVGALVGLGIPEDDARYYEDRIRSGAILVVVPVTAGLMDEARDILETAGAEQVRDFGEEHSRSRLRDDKEYRTPAYYSDVRRKKDLEEEER